ncbi:FlgO family outer membrane protein [Rheinheimera baltica]|uniref:FlgO family outer membrane protein n=1 Tax=Rheinheimera baltica TaxID=67576 RepID=UPI00273D4443|nr:FlgO family outer membrane protein [Rheinheimera baltica]MDP5192089.1 FlgO family outer membrane protein [Rheinheimera baltica]
MKSRMLLTGVTALLITGCYSHHRIENGYTYCNSVGECSSEIRRQHHDHHSRDAVSPMPQQQGSTMIGWTLPSPTLTNLNSNKQLDDYAAQMSMQLVDTLHNFPITSRVAIASFVELGSELNRTNIVGNQLAESFMHQLQQFGIAVVDFKTTRDIQVTANGDFVFSRAHNKLDSIQMIDYVLSGTMIHTPKGIMVNARVIDFRTKVIAGSAQQLIPHFVIGALYSDNISQ